MEANNQPDNEKTCDRCGEAYSILPPVASDYQPALYAFPYNTTEEAGAANARIRATIRTYRQHGRVCRNRRSPRQQDSRYGRVHGIDGDSAAADLLQYMEADLAEDGPDGDYFYGIGMGGGNW